MARLNLKLIGTFFLSYFLIIVPCYAQKFEWCKDGYNPNVKTYTNIDDSGIDLEISGIYASYRSCVNNEHYIYTGINDNGISGVKHNYEFSFSEYVDLEFTIYDINADSSNGGFRYYDYLEFSSSPTFSNYNSSIIIKDNVILPNADHHVNSEVTVKYKNIKNFSIQHGLGKRFNPGFILISPLIINGDKLGKPKLYNQISYSELAVFKQNTPVINAYFIASTGQLINGKFKSEESGITRISTSDLAAGIYVVFVEFESGDVLKEKVMVLH